MNKRIISFDFDGTLDQEWVQNIAKTFISNGDIVFVITSRCPKHENRDVWEICHKLGIGKHQVFMTDIFPKFNEIIRLQVDIHFENDFMEFLSLRNNGINCVLIDTTNLDCFQQDKIDFNEI